MSTPSVHGLNLKFLVFRTLVYGFSTNLHESMKFIETFQNRTLINNYFQINFFQVIKKIGAAKWTEKIS